MRSEQNQRDEGLDALRGLAIVAMVASHLAREVLADPHPLWLRMFGSLAAPLFITLAGMLTAQTAAIKNYPLNHYLKRGSIILLLAALVDVLLWGTYPFMGCDVLYVIGIALPLTACYARLSLVWQAVVLALVLLLPSVLRPMLGYPEDVWILSLAHSPLELLANAERVVHQWLLSGWFPLFPWLGFSFLGVWIYRWRQIEKVSPTKGLAVGGLTMTCLGGLSAYFFPLSLLERGGYTELFYPPTLAYLLMATGIVLLLFSLARWSPLAENQPLVQLGRCPLLMYLVHLAILHWMLEPLVGEVELTAYLLLYAALLLILIGLAGGVALSKKQRSTRHMPLMLRLLLGG